VKSCLEPRMASLIRVNHPVDREGRGFEMVELKKISIELPDGSQHINWKRSDSRSQKIGAINEGEG